MTGFPTVSSDANQNYLSIAEFLMSNGFSRAAAAGIAGTIAGESAGNPESVGSGGAGLIGWTPPSSAKPEGDIVTGNAQSDFNKQLTDLLYYAQNEGQGNLSELKSQTSAINAADMWSQLWERPAVTDSDVRSSVVSQVYDQLANYKPNSAYTQVTDAAASSSSSQGGGGLLGDIWEGTGIPQFFSDADSFVNKLVWLTKPSSWLRIGAFLAGVALLLFAFHAFMAVAAGEPIIQMPNVVPVPV